MDAVSVARKVAEREFSAEEYIQQVLERIKKVEPKVNAFITVNKNAIEQARSLDRKIRDGKDAGPLAGVAVGIKDNISTKGIRTTCASKMLDNYVPPYDATVVKQLQDAGAVIVGKVNLDEFAMGSTTEFSRHGPTRNPWDTSRVPGGSSGGSAASVAALECAVSLGSDTGGSVRCPASFCSVVGLKPTYGLVSRFGLVSYANSLEQVGPVGRTVADVASVLDVISGFDERDHTTAAGKQSYGAGKKRPLRVGLVKEFIEGADEQVSKIIYDAVNTLAKEGCKCEEASLPSVKYALASYYTIAMAEASSNLARYDNMRYGFDASPDGYEWNSYFSHTRGNFGEEVKRRIITGSYVLSSGYYGKYYLKAQQVRSIIRKELKSLFGKFDVLAGPTMPILPFKIGEKLDDPLKMYLVDVDTVVANLAAVPAISVPAGFAAGLPVGLQLMADEFCEQTLFDAAGVFESAANVRGSPDL
ncbi:Asp-tRNA(Asn)/Glu-tRNA(Gln) amidotransferase subunit GatA [Nitrososphaera sp.]|uniref:Asp-tRNA(Asn)/Glu-tRNA(Gln) amidotransferase subunit GatA n=1 Tax=Nitrososphaera sp. TaxID=1971748 RepID=UPI002ED83BD9